MAATVRVEDKSSPGHPLMPMLYGTEIPSLFRRPLLGAQYETMKGWPPTLKATPNATLQAYGAQIEALVPDADAAIDADRAATQALDHFRLIGGRPALADMFNGLRKATHGALGKLGHDKKYPKAFAESFFRHSAAVRDPSLDELDRKLAAAASEVKRLQDKRGELAAVQQAGEKVRADAAKAGKLAALAEAEKSQKEQADRIAALKAELGA